MLILSLFATGILSICVINPTPISASSSSVYYSTSNDGTITSYSDNYTLAHDSHVVSGYDNCSAESTTPSILSGQNFDSSVYTIYRSVFVFDTTSLPSYATISSWSAMFYGLNNDNSTTDNICLVQGGDIHNPLQYSDFDVLLPKTTQISTSLSNADFQVGTYNTFVGTSTDVINIGGYTVIGIRFAEDISSSSPSGANYISVASSESAHPPKLIVTYTSSALDSADTIGLSGVAVFSKFRTTGDQLFVFQTTVKYATTPTINSPSDYYLISLYDTDNTTLIAQTPLARWGYSPQSIYLSPSHAVTWGNSYLLTISSTPLILTSTSYSYSLQSSDWKGSSPSALKGWTYQTANWMGLSEQSNYRYYYDANDYTKINTEGTQIFTTGIPYINTAMPSIFDVPGVDTGETPTATNSYSSSLYGHWGTYWPLAFNAIASSFGTTGTWIWGMFIVFFCVIAYAIVSKSTHNSGLSLLCTVPIIGIGVFFGAPPLVAVSAGLVAAGGYLLTVLVLNKM